MRTLLLYLDKSNSIWAFIVPHPLAIFNVKAQVRTSKLVSAAAKAI